MALVFSAIGIYQYETRDVFWNPKLLVSQRLRALLPRQLGLLGPVDLRALPGRRDPGAARRRAVRARPARAARRARPRSPRSGPGSTSRTRSRASRRSWPGSCSPRSSPGAGAGSCSPSSRPWSSLAAARSPCRTSATTSSATTRLTARRAAAATLVRTGRHIAVHHPVVGRRRRRLQARLRRARPPEGQGAEGRRLAQHAGHRRRRDGHRRPRALRLAARRRRCSSPSGASRATCAGLTALTFGLVFAVDRRPQPLLQRVLRGPDGLGRARPGGRGVAGAASGRRDEPAQPSQLDRQVEPEREQDQRVDGASAGRRRRAGRRAPSRAPLARPRRPTTSAIRRHWYGTGKTCCARTVIPRNITT